MGPRAAEGDSSRGPVPQKPFPGRGSGWTQLRGAKNHFFPLDVGWNPWGFKHPSPKRLLGGREVASEAPEGPSQPQLRSKEGEAACQEEGLNEVTVLVASVEAINTHKVVLQHLSPWQPRLPSSVDSESSAQRGGCQCICIWLRAHVCPCGCCERSHQCTGEGGGNPRRGPWSSFSSSSGPRRPFSPFWPDPFSCSLFLSLPPSSCLSPFFQPFPVPPLSCPLSAPVAPCSVSSRWFTSLLPFFLTLHISQVSSSLEESPCWQNNKIFDWELPFFLPWTPRDWVQSKPQGGSPPGRQDGVHLGWARAPLNFNSWHCPPCWKASL